MGFFMAIGRQIFMTVLKAYDLAVLRCNRPVSEQQRVQDVLATVTEFNRQYQERLAKQRERRKRAELAKSMHAQEMQQ